MLPSNYILFILFSLSMLPIQGAIFSNFTSEPNPSTRSIISTDSTYQSMAWLFAAGESASSLETVHLKVGLYNSDWPGQSVSVAIQFYSAGGNAPENLLLSQITSLDGQKVLELNFSGVEFHSSESYWFVVSAVSGDGKAAVQLYNASPPLDSTLAFNSYHYGETDFSSSWVNAGSGFSAPNMEITVVPEPAFYGLSFGILCLGAVFVRRSNS